MSEMTDERLSDDDIADFKVRLAAWYQQCVEAKELPSWEYYALKMTMDEIDRLRTENERLTAALRAIEKIECMEDHDEINEPCPLNIAYDALNPEASPPEPCTCHEGYRDCPVHMPEPTS